MATITHDGQRTITCVCTVQEVEEFGTLAAVCSTVSGQVQRVLDTTIEAQAQQDAHAYLGVFRQATKAKRAAVLAAVAAVLEG